MPLIIDLNLRMSEIISGLTELKSMSDRAFYGSSLDRNDVTDIQYTNADKAISRATEKAKEMSLENAVANTVLIRIELNLASSEIDKYAAIIP